MTTRLGDMGAVLPPLSSVGEGLGSRRICSDNGRARSLNPHQQYAEWPGATRHESRTRKNHGEVLSPIASGANGTGWAPEPAVGRAESLRRRTIWECGDAAKPGSVVPMVLCRIRKARFDVGCLAIARPPRLHEKYGRAGRRERQCGTIGTARRDVGLGSLGGKTSILSCANAGAGTWSVCAEFCASWRGRRVGAPKLEAATELGRV